MTIPSADASPASEATFHIRRFPSEIRAGRLMRAPDHVAPEDNGPIVEPAAVAVEGEATPDANTAASSPADAPDAKEPVSLLSVIKSAVEAPAVPEASSAAESETVEPAAEAPAAEVTEPTAEDDAKLPFHNHPRWKAVLAERDTLKEPAENYTKITTFMQTHGLVADEVAEGFEVMALLKSGDPENLGKARDWFAERLAMLDSSLGNVLPDDLRERVESGLIDEEGAQELARARASQALRVKGDEERATRTAEEQRADAARATSVAMATAVEGWETRIKASDPDYSKKAAMVETTCLAIIQRTGKPPTNATEAVALADQALADVNAQLKGIAPKPKAIIPQPTGSSALTTTAPKTLREAINAAVGR